MASFAPARRGARDRWRFNEWGGTADTWRDVTPQGKHQTYYGDGTLRVEVTYRDGQRDGHARWYREDGKLREERTYRNGVLLSKKEYDEAGSLVRDEEYFEDGSRKRK